jgi:predicted O-methyltransferase YrrM
MDIIDASLNAYLLSLTPESPGPLAEMEATAKERKFPIVGPLVGRFLQQVVRLTGAKRIFEMGSGFGYSAIWMALAMEPGGRIDCTETDADNVELGRRYADQAGVGERIVWHHQDALQAIRLADGLFDMVLNDVDKHQYPQALELAWPRVRRGGVMITDNALWSGRVVRESPPAESTQGVLQINQAAYQLPDAVTTLLPLRDGLLMLLKS